MIVQLRLLYNATLFSLFFVISSATFSQGSQDSVMYRESRSAYCCEYAVNGTLSETGLSPFKGLKHLQFTYQTLAYYAGFGLGLSDPALRAAKDASLYSYLNIAYKGPSGAGDKLTLVLEDANGTRSGLTYFQTNEYSVITIPLKNFLNVDVSQLIYLHVQVLSAQAQQAGTLYIDEVFFSGYKGSKSKTGNDVFIKVDQFGYLPCSKKVAVLSDPQIGYNAVNAYTPGNWMEVRRAKDHAVVYAGAPVVWKKGATHVQSGDRGSWFDFTPVSKPDTYYLYDTTTHCRSFPFQVSDTVYRPILKHAMRMYFYQRVGYAKKAPYTNEAWADDASYIGQGQDGAATSRFKKGDLTTSKDLSGGWMDAGDPNKYTTFAESAVIQLLEAYRSNSSVFLDNYQIPESGNGIPDILDEVKWELDWLKRMQDATGTGGFMLKVGVDNFTEVSPPSMDQRPRYYLPECTSSTLAGCAMFALAGQVYQTLGRADLRTYGQDLLQRAESAWTRSIQSTFNFTRFETDCDDQDIKAGDADRTIDEQWESAVTAAIYLYEATGKASYRAFVEQNISRVRPYKDAYWSPYRMHTAFALLKYARLPGASRAVSTAILTQKAGMNYAFSLNNYKDSTDFYRAHMEDWAHHWGSNQVRANAGNLNLDFVYFGINTSEHNLYRELTEQYLHWLHGVNPTGLSMLSNMYAYGGDSCANEIYHSWFADKSPWDHALKSPFGPAPGYLTGGPNTSFSVPNLTPPANQPPQKAYKDWNTSYPENSWEITEPAIYYQAAYIRLLSSVIGNANCSGGIQGAGPLPVTLASFTAKVRYNNTVQLSWETSTEIQNDYFEVERWDPLSGQFEKIGRVDGKNAPSLYGFVDEDPALPISYYRLKQVDTDGAWEYSSIVEARFSVSDPIIQIYPNPVQSHVNVSMGKLNKATMLVEIFDIQGKLQGKWIQDNGQSLQIPLDHLQQGTYFIRVNIGGTLVQSEKIVKN